MKRSKVIVLGSTIGALALLGIGGAGIAHSIHYSDHVLPGTQVAGIDISGMTRDQVVAALDEKVAATTVTVDVAGTKTTASLGDLGVTIDTGGTADTALAPNSDLMRRFALGQTSQVQVVSTIDEAKLDAYAESLEAPAGAQMRDATVEPAPDGKSFIHTESAEGVKVDRAGLKDAVVKASSQLAAGDFAYGVTHTPPATNTDKARQIADKANGLIAHEVTITDGVDDYTASPEDKIKWVSIPNKDGALGDPVLDSAKVKEWVDALAEQTNEEAPQATRSINSQGKVVSTQYPGGKSWRAKNQQEVTDGIMSAFSKGESYKGDFDYDEVEPELKDVNVPDWSKDDVYKPKGNEKWIDLDLGNNTVSAYEGRVLVYGPTPMVPGEPGLETVTGTYKIYLKYEVQTMKGTNLDGSEYETPDVPWVSYFHLGYGFHGAPWRDSFGWSGPGGSHGCVNMPVDAAKFIYDWSDYETVVNSHY
ncbi:MAG: L,D-transpeptidase [Actinomycetaceae bacterium]|nr:L,D-transpeptidase [Actinomycetaceae bacterium]